MRIVASHRPPINEHVNKPSAQLIIPRFLDRCASRLVIAAQITVLATSPLSIPLPALANTENFSIDVRESEEEEYFQTVPQGLTSADDDSNVKVPRLGALLNGPKGKEIQQCSRKCVPTCIRGGQGAPGLGPMSVRKEIVVFKEGYRSRQYCLSECIQVCALSIAPPPAADSAVGK